MCRSNYSQLQQRIAIEKVIATEDTGLEVSDTPEQKKAILSCQWASGLYTAMDKYLVRSFTANPRLTRKQGHISRQTA